LPIAIKYNLKFYINDGYWLLKKKKYFFKLVLLLFNFQGQRYKHKKIKSDFNIFVKFISPLCRCFFITDTMQGLWRQQYVDNIAYR
jgi:hypothetical protein